MVDRYKPKLTNLQQAILKLLFVKFGEKLNQRAIAINLGVSATAVMKAVPEMQKQNLIVLLKDKDSKRLSIELNGENNLVMQLKRADNLKQIYESGLADFLENEFAGGTIILFGSYSRGEDTIRSDVDIAIIGRKQKDTDLGKFEDSLEREIVINFYESFKKINENLKNNILNGIVLSGSVLL